MPVRLLNHNRYWKWYCCSMYIYMYISSLSSSKVTHQQLCASLRSFQPPTSPFGQLPQTEYSVVSLQYFWQPGFFQSPVWRFGTHFLIPCVIRPSSLNVLGRTRKRISLPSDIRDMSISEVSPFHGIAVYKSTFTYSLLTGGLPTAQEGLSKHLRITTCEHNIFTSMQYSIKAFGENRFENSTAAPLLSSLYDASYIQTVSKVDAATMFSQNLFKLKLNWHLDVCDRLFLPHKYRLPWQLWLRVSLSGPPLKSQPRVQPLWEQQWT